MEIALTDRGFAHVTFTDRGGVACSLQESSLASEAAILLGCNEADPRVLVPNTGWQPVEMPKEFVANTHMHLTQQQVAALLPHLQRFVETGGLQ